MEKYFLFAIDRYSKYLTVELLNKASESKVIKSSTASIYNLGVPRLIRQDQAKSLTGIRI